MSVALPDQQQLPVFGKQEYENALDAGQKVLFLTRSRSNSTQLFNEIGGIKHTKVDSYRKQDGIYSLRAGNARVFILTMHDVAYTICGVRGDFVILEDQKMLSEVDYQTILMPFLAVKENSDQPRLYKLK